MQTKEISLWIETNIQNVVQQIKLHQILTKLGFTQTKADYALFNRLEGHTTTFILVYVDDLLITENNLQNIIQLKKDLTKHFNIKDLDKLKYFLGINFSNTQEGTFMSQRKYAIENLKNKNYIDSKPTTNPSCKSSDQTCMYNKRKTTGRPN